MQFQTQHDEQETLNLLRSIEKRLATLAPTANEMFDELEPATKKAVIDQVIDSTPLSDVYDFVEANPVLTAKQRERDEASRRAMVARAKAADLPYDTRLDDTARRMHKTFEVANTQ